MILYTDINEQITDVLIELATHSRVVECFGGDKIKIKRKTGDWRHSLEQSLLNCDSNDVNSCLQQKKEQILSTIDVWILNDL